MGGDHGEGYVMLTEHKHKVLLLNRVILMATFYISSTAVNLYIKTLHIKAV